ncbi:MAG: aspartate carbamoyltransferase regulatory subunit [Oscillospiraceae bacterium]|nr:aspartate carbamoyltransferase regulatory subunit [Oscillospiraceae bacterium]
MKKYTTKKLEGRQVLDCIQEGTVIDHIPTGKTWEILGVLGLWDYAGTIAVLRNVESSRYGAKDIIKFDDVERDVSLVGLFSPKPASTAGEEGDAKGQITVSRIKGTKVIEKTWPSPVEKVKNVIRCKNPRCITSSEQEIDQVFSLAQPEPPVYRCRYCQADVHEWKINNPTNEKFGGK